MRDFLSGFWKVVRVVLMFLRVAIYLIIQPKTTQRLVRWLPKYIRDGGNFADNDYYEWTMIQMFWRRYKHLVFEMVLTVRSVILFPPGFAEAVMVKVNKFAQNCSFMDPEIAAIFLNAAYIGEDFIKYLTDPAVPKLFAEHVHVTQHGGDLEVKIVGPGFQSSWWEEIMLSIISTTLYEMTGQKLRNFDWMLSAQDKMIAFKKLKAPVSEFGTRRRYSFWTQLWVDLVALATGSVQTPTSKGGLVGTSNVFIAYLLGIPFMGTMAHKAFMALGAAYGQENTNPLMVKAWKHEYGNEVGYVLADTQGTDEFLRTVDFETIRDFTGIRQDSGEAEEVARKIYAHYAKHLPKKWIRSKTIIFSDNLNLEKVKRLMTLCAELGIGCSFGIGTNLTNDIEGIKPTNNVIKLYRVWLDGHPENFRYAVKIGDPAKGKASKHMGDPETLRQVLEWLDPFKRIPITIPPLIAELPEYLNHPPFFDAA